MFVVIEQDYDLYEILALYVDESMAKAHVELLEESRKTSQYIRGGYFVDEYEISTELPRTFHTVVVDAGGYAEYTNVGRTLPETQSRFSFYPKRKVVGSASGWTVEEARVAWKEASALTTEN